MYKIAAVLCLLSQTANAEPPDAVVETVKILGSKLDETTCAWSLECTDDFMAKVVKRRIEKTIENFGKDFVGRVETSKDKVCAILVTYIHDKWSYSVWSVSVDGKVVNHGARFH